MGGVLGIKLKFFIPLSLWVFFHLTASQAQGPSYECRRESGHVIHILTLHPANYAVHFVKAHNSVFGRETLISFAKRMGADIAVNTGFFEIGNSEDGMPSGTLIINQQIFGLTFQKQGCLVYDQKSFTIQTVTPHLTVRIGKNTFAPQKVNKFPKETDVVLYSHLWGAHTLTPLKERKEITIDADRKVTDVSQEGNRKIAPGGFVLSLPSSYGLDPITIGDKVLIKIEPSSFLRPKASVVMGIPILIQDGKINPALHKNQTSFYKSAHARTAVGVRENGELVIIVAEHVYQKPLQDVTLEEVKSIILNNKMKLMKKYKKLWLNNLTLSEMKEIINQEFTAQGSAIGLTLPELAALMKDLNCASAINLDGGGSSSLFFNNQVVNHTVGDQDEHGGQSILRPLSSALVFKAAP